MTSAQNFPAPRVSEWVLTWSNTRPHRPALIGADGAARSWSDLAARQEALAGALHERGVRRGDRVACLLGNRAEFIEAFLGVARLGAIFVPVNVRMTAPEVALVLGDAEATVVVTDAAHRHLLGSATGSSVIDIDIDVLPEGTAAVRDAPLPAADDPVAILYTSGTTGRPKGAVFTHRAFHHTALNQQAALGLTAEDRHLVVSPLGFTGGILTSVQPALATGGTILLEPDFDPERLLSRMRAEAATVFMAVPTMLSRLLEAPGFTPDAFASLRYLGSGSAPAPHPLLERYLEFGVNIGHAYGLTEGGGITSQLDPADSWEHIGSAGRACVHVELRIADITGAPVAPGTVGEIWHRGPNATSGYWRNPEATAQLITPDGWIRTGDLGRLDEAGYLTVVGRTKDVVITGGMNVYPADVESVLVAHPSVAEAAVVGTPHPVYGETVVAVVVPHEGAVIVLDELREFCRPRLADYKIPRLLETVTELPRTASGKVLKSAVRANLSIPQPH